MNGYTLKEEVRVPGSGGGATTASKTDRIEIIDLEGKQVGDLMAWIKGSDSEWFSPAHTVTQNWRINLRTNDLLVTNKRRPVFKIIRDDVGYHDIVVPCCDEEAYVRRYGLKGHRSCLGNIQEALEAINEPSRHVSGELAWNMFMKNRIGDDGEMIYEEPVHGAGSSLVLEALEDVVLALSACPQDQTPTNGWNCSPMLMRIWQLDD